MQVLIVMATAACPVVWSQLWRTATLNLSLHLINLIELKMYWEGQVQFHAFFTLTLHTGERWTSSSSFFTPPAKRAAVRTGHGCWMSQSVGEDAMSNNDTPCPPRKWNWWCGLQSVSWLPYQSMVFGCVIRVRHKSKLSKLSLPT